jgi:hypothetical protein
MKLARVARCVVHEQEPNGDCPICQLRGALVGVKANVGGVCRIVHLVGPVPDRDVVYVSHDTLADLSPLEQLVWEAA